MAMSAEARQGLRAAVAYNPHAACLLLGILRDAAPWVKHKPDDQYGPLGVILGEQPRRDLAPGISVPVHRQPVSASEFAACRRLNAEWLRRDFSKQDLAEVLAEILTDMGVRCA
jgi:hypothetical protein